MGSKHRIYRGFAASISIRRQDPFAGSGYVAYLPKAMGKRVIASDFLNFPAVPAAATLGADVAGNLFNKQESVRNGGNEQSGQKRLVS
jgi:hypothetical protein